MGDDSHDEEVNGDEEHENEEENSICVGRFRGMIIQIFFSLRKKKSRFNGHGRSVLEWSYYTKEGWFQGFGKEMATCVGEEGSDKHYKSK